MSTRKVSYFYHDDVGKFFYYKDHPMKPKRMAMTHSLI
jgi:histone deacetylase 1/2